MKESCVRTMSKFTGLLVACVLLAASSAPARAGSGAEPREPCPPLVLPASADLLKHFGSCGAPFKYQIQAVSFPGSVSYKIAAGALPNGLIMSASGLISGTPLVDAAHTSAKFAFTVTAIGVCEAGKKTATKGYEIQLYPADCSGFSFTGPAALPGAVILEQYRYQLAAASAYPVTFKLAGGGLPPGLALASSGLISGAAVRPGRYSFTVSAVDGCPSCTSAGEFPMPVTRAISLSVVKPGLREPPPK